MNESALATFYQIFLLIYGAGWVASNVLVQNAYVEYTYTRAGVFGVLYSNRYVTAYWFALSFSTGRMVMFMVVCCYWLYRRTSFCGSRNCCFYWWWSLMVALLTLEAIVLAIYGSYYSKCNEPNQPDNPCNDLLYCCDPVIYGDPANMCPNSDGCTPAWTLAQASANSDFVWLFAVSVVFLCADLVFVALPLFGRILMPTPTEKSGITTSEDENYDYEEDNIAEESAGGGLRQRRKMTKQT